MTFKTVTNKCKIQTQTKISLNHVRLISNLTNNMQKKNPAIKI